MGRHLLNNKGVFKVKRRKPKARRLLIIKYGHCAITGYTNPLEYQSAHIIPRSIGYEIEFDRVDSSSNCILLSHGLHSLFDSFVWTVDVYSFLDIGVQSETHFKVMLLIKQIPQPGSSCLCNYINKQITLPIEYFPSLYIHYNVYLCHNYTASNKTMQQLFKYYINTKDYQTIKSFRRTSDFKDYFIDKRTIKNSMRLIIGHKSKTYHTLWKYWSFQHSSYEYSETISADLLETYDNYKEHLTDPNWIP